MTARHPDAGPPTARATVMEPIPASEAYAPPYEGNEDMWEARPREGGVVKESADG